MELLKEDDPVPEDDWIPGDWGRINNDNHNPLRLGLVEKERITFTSEVTFGGGILALSKSTNLLDGGKSEWKVGTAVPVWKHGDAIQK